MKQCMNCNEHVKKADLTHCEECGDLNCDKCNVECEGCCAKFCLDDVIMRKDENYYCKLCNKDYNRISRDNKYYKNAGVPKIPKGMMNDMIEDLFPFKFIKNKKL